jgi:hypothetical protein
MLKAFVASVGASVLAFGAYLWISASRIIGGRPGVAVDIGDLIRVTLRSPSFWVLMVFHAWTSSWVHNQGCRVAWA